MSDILIAMAAWFLSAAFYSCATNIECQDKGVSKLMFGPVIECKVRIPE